MRRYARVVARTAVQSLAFRSEILIWFILDTIPILILLVVWQTMFVNQTTIQNVTFTDVLGFYLLTFLIGFVTNCHFEYWRIDEVRQGKIDYLLVKPLGYIRDIALRHIGDKLTSSALKAPLLVLLATFLLITTDSLPMHIDLTTAGIFTVFLVWSFVVQMLFGMLIVFTGFWLESAQGIDHFKWMTISLLSGVLMPIALMPSWLQSLTMALPFKYLYAVPIGVLQGHLTVSYVDVVYAGSFLLALTLVVRLVWHKAKHRYSSVGG